jgi:hypothetical protein
VLARPAIDARVNRSRSWDQKCRSRGKSLLSWTRLNSPRTQSPRFCLGPTEEEQRRITPGEAANATVRLRRSRSAKPGRRRCRGSSKVAVGLAPNRPARPAQLCAHVRAADGGAGAPPAHQRGNARLRARDEIAEGLRLIAPEPLLELVADPVRDRARFHVALSSAAQRDPTTPACMRARRRPAPRARERKAGARLQGTRTARRTQPRAVRSLPGTDGLRATPGCSTSDLTGATGALSGQCAGNPI